MEANTQKDEEIDISAPNCTHMCSEHEPYAPGASKCSLTCAPSMAKNGPELIFASF